MAVIEIKAATLPGFPYYFPYRTGVRLRATIDALGGKTFTGSASAAITAEATVTSERTAIVLADLVATATTSSENEADYTTDADIVTTADLTAEAGRDAGVSSDTAVSAVANAFASRDQLLESSLSLGFTSAAAGTTSALFTAEEVITASFSAAARLDGVGYADLALSSSFAATEVLAAAADAYSVILASSDPDFIQDHLASASADIVALATGEIGLGTTILSPVLEVTSDQTGTLSRVLFGSAELEIAVTTAVDFSNIATALDLTADFAAEGHRTQYPEATLGVFAEALVDCFGIRYGSVEQNITATAPVVMSNGRILDPGQTEVSVTCSAEVVLTRYVAADLAITTSTGDILVSQDQQLSASVPITVTRDTTVMRTHNAIATRAITANSPSVVLRETYTAAELALVANRSAASRTQLVTSAMLTSSAALPTVFIMQALLDAAIDATADLAALSTGEFFAESFIDTTITTFLADSVMEFPFAANLRVNTDLELSGGLVVGTDSDLQIQAEPTARIENLKYIESPNLEVLTTFEVPTVQFILSANAELELRAATSAIGLWRSSGGNPMWLMFFFAGHGRQYPVAAPGSAEE